MSGGRTRIGAVVAAALVSVLVASPATAEGGGGEVRLRLSDSSGLRDRQVVDYTVSGRAITPGRIVDVYQCDADVEVEVGGTASGLARSCTGLGSQQVQDGERSVTGSLTVREVFTTSPVEPDVPRPFHCGDERRDCSIVVTVRTDWLSDTIAAADVVPISVAPSPVAIGAASFGADVVQVWVSGQPRARLSLAQCVHFPGVPRDLDDCRPGPDIVLSHRGQATTEMTLAPSLEVDGRTYDCRRRPCEVTLFDRTGAIVAAVGVPWFEQYVEITLDRSTGLTHGDVVRARVAVAAPSYGLLGLCLASVLDDVPTPEEGCLTYNIAVIGPTVSEYEITVYERFTPFSGGPEVSCSDDPRGCIVAVGTSTTAGGYVPISFAGPAPPPVVAPSW